MASEKDFKVKNGVLVGTNITFESANAGGVLSWNDIDGTLDITLNSQVTLQSGQEQLFYAKATENIANGDVVMFAGAQGDHLLIAKANIQAVGFKPEYVIGVATQSFVTNDFGYVSTFGKVRGLNTSAFTEGTILYLNPSVAGALTSTSPTDGNHVIQMAAVVKQHATEGTIFVRPLHKIHLEELEDVNVSSLIDGQALVWDTSTSRWINANVYSSTDFSTDFALKDTDDLSEGATNQYFTTARARSSISASGSLSYNSTTGALTYTQGNSDTVSEGTTNLYFTNDRFDTRLATKTTSNLTEGTNLYYTDARVSTYLTSNDYTTKAQAEADAVALAIALG